MNNTANYETKYGIITLFKNEIYIGSVFNNGKYWDEDTLLKLKKYIDPFCNILEIGGHCGTSSILYSTFIDNDSKVFVYEPQQEMYNLLVKNINQNNLKNKIIPVKQGIFCFEGLGKMNNIDLDGGGGEVSKRYNDEKELPCNFGGICLGFEGEIINLTTIDNLNLSNLGFIHCDAQGSENFIFSKGLNTINQNKPFILYENNQMYATYLYKNVCNAYPEYINESKFDIKEYCIKNLNYSCIEKFNNSIDNLLIPPQKNFDKIIHITNKTIDDKLLKVKKEWLDLNYEYKIELYDDVRCLEILHKYYGNKYCDIFNFIKDGPIKCDFFRVCILYIYGGIYADSDISPVVSLKEFVDEDVDLMTCASYNYHLNNNGIFAYNPHFIVCKKYSPEILNVINTYEYMYDNRGNYPYDYWRWSICTIFTKITNFDITPNGDNIFIHKNRKYKFIIEEVINVNTNETYNFENYLENKEHLKKVRVDVYCKYKNNIVLYNFINK